MSELKRNKEYLEKCREIDHLKARVLELQDAITLAIACMYTEDELVFNEILRVAQRNQHQSLLLHDAEVFQGLLDDLVSADLVYHDRDSIIDTVEWRITRLRQQAE